MKYFYYAVNKIMTEVFNCVLCMIYAFYSVNYILIFFKFFNLNFKLVVELMI